MNFPSQEQAREATTVTILGKDRPLATSSVCQNDDTLV